MNLLRLSLLSFIATYTSASAVAGQASTLNDASEGKRLYWKGCWVDEGSVNIAVCRQALQHLKLALKADPSSPPLNFLYGAAEILLDRPNSGGDGLRRVMSAIQAQPDLADAYYFLVDAAILPAEENIRLLRQLIKNSPKEDRAYARLIFALDSDPVRNGDEIVKVHQQYRAVFPVGAHDFYIEPDLDAAETMRKAGRLKDAANIYQGILDFGQRDGNPGSVCAELLSVDPELYHNLAAFHSSFLRFRRYCTETDHYQAAIKLRESGKLREATQQLELQIKSNPYYLATFSQLATLYLELGSKADAARILREFSRGDWSPAAKCEQLGDFGDLSQYRVAGENTVDVIQSACKEAK